MLLRRDEQQDAVILGFFAKLPSPEKFVGVRLDFLAVERVDCRDDELDAGLLFEIGELLLDLLRVTSAGMTLA